MTPGSRRSLRRLLRVVDALRWLAPASRRREWRRQWRADLWHQWAWLDRRPHGARDRLDVAARLGGAARHALWLRTNERTLDMISHDLRYGWRMMLRRPGFTIAAVLMLGLGIGANVAIYSWVEALLLHPMPGVADADRFVVLTGATRARNDLSTSWPNFVDIRTQRPASIEDLVASRNLALNIRTHDEAQRIWGMLVSANYFDVLGVKPALGRGFLPEDDRAPEASPVAVFSHAYWQTHLGGDPSILGRTVQLNGRAFTVVGIAPPRFRGHAAALGFDVWVPMMMQKTVMAGDRLGDRGTRWLQVLVKRKPDVSLARAQGDFDVIGRNLAAADPGSNPPGDERRLLLSPLWRAPGTAAGVLLPLLSLLMAVVAVVLLIVCANVANLLLARAAGRQRETAVRLALGAKRSRIVQQLLTENLLLAAAGGAVGAVLAFWTADLLKTFIPPTGPLAIDTTMNGRALAFAMLATLGSALVFGLAPAWQGSSSNLVTSLKDGAATLSSSPRKTRLRHALVAAQVALSLMLLVSAGLFVQTLRNAQTLDVGFSTRSGLLASVDLLPAGYDEPRGTALFRELLRRLRDVPGVQGATLTRTLPLNLGGGSDTFVAIDGYTPAGNEALTAYYTQVGSDYTRTLGVRVIEGRDLSDRDAGGGVNVGLINETMARRYWSGRRAIGGKIRTMGRDVEVVGIVADGKYATVTEPPRNFMYLSVQQWYRPDTSLVVKTDGDPVAVLPAVRRAIREIDPNLALFDTRTIAEHLDLALFVQRIAATLLGGFGALALLLATIGLYAVVAFGVSQRTPEIGMRMALGATRADIVGLVLKQGLWVTLVGVVLGVAGSLAVTRLFKSQLVGVGATDAASFAATCTLLLLVALAATYLPARRAASIDPLRALRQE